jgi:hypothetical protein
MRAAVSLAILIGASFLGVSLAAASETGPTIVIPGRPGVPVFINGREASYSVVEGDWGLARSFSVQPTVYGGWSTYEAPQVGHYYPSAGRMPGYGRYEIEPPPNRVLPQPAESFHQSWTAQSGPPAPPQQNNFEVPYYPPPVIPAPPYPPQQGQNRPRPGQHFPHARN